MTIKYTVEKCTIVFQDVMVFGGPSWTEIAYYPYPLTIGLKLHDRSAFNLGIF